MLMKMQKLPDDLSPEKRLQHARKERTSLNQRQVAERLGVTPQAVSQWERGEDSPSSSNLRKLAELYDVPMDWLALRKQAFPTGAQMHWMPKPSRIPLISSVKAGEWAQAWDPYQLGDGETFFFTETQVSDSSFALKIEGSSMEPAFSDGDIVIIDPRIQPRPGDFVVAKLVDQDEATFKKYRPRGNGTIELVPLNSDWPTLIIDDNHPGQIVGTMVEHRRFRRK